MSDKARGVAGEKINKLADELKEKQSEKFFLLFIMPMIILTIRIQIEVIFQMTFDKFYNNKGASGKKILDMAEPEDSYHVKRA